VGVVRIPAPPGADRKDRTMPLVDNRTQQLNNVLAHCVAKREAVRERLRQPRATPTSPAASPCAWTA